MLKRHLRTLGTIVFFVLQASSPCFAAEELYERYSFTQLTQGHDVIWGMDFLDENTIIFTERSGNISLFDLTNQEITSLSGSPEVKSSGQGGMLDVKVGPEYDNDGWVYFTYSKPVGKKGATTLARARVKQHSLTGWQDLLVTNSATDTNQHYGSRIAFDNNGHLFFSVGDRGVRPNGQDLSTHAGSVLRLNLDGTIPGDNPFRGRTDALPEIYSYGHRNPQGVSYDHANEVLWVIEHGPRGGDEINLILPGRNYGWPVVSHGKEYFAPIPVGEATEKEGMESPKKVYIPSIAPGSLLLYSGRRFPKWEHVFLAGALKLRHINIVKLDSSNNPVSELRILQELNERIRALIEGPTGLIYFSTDSGKIFRLDPR